MPMPKPEPYEQACDCDAEDGAVIVVPPGGSTIRFTPDAAEECADRLTSAALKARGQIYFENRLKPRR